MSEIVNVRRPGGSVSTSSLREYDVTAEKSPGEKVPCEEYGNIIVDVPAGTDGENSTMPFTRLVKMAGKGVGVRKVTTNRSWPAASKSVDGKL